MVKLKGPGLGLAAAGSVGGEVSFANWKGKPYLKTKSRPKQPNTESQIALRAIMRFLSKAWAAIDPALKATWNELAAATTISPFNAYQAYNIKRWHNFKAPSTTYPCEERLDYSNYVFYGVTGGPRSVLHDLTSGTQFHGWGYLLHKLTDTDDDRRWDNLFYAFTVPEAGEYRHTTSPHPAGTHHWMCTNFSLDGKMRDYSFRRSCTVLP